MSDYRALAERVKRLERSGRRSAVLAVSACFAFAISVALSSEDGAGVVSARTIALVGEHGQVLAEFGAADGEVYLSLRDSEGRDRVTLTHGATRSGLFVRDMHGHARVAAAQFAHGGGGFALHGEDMKGAAVLYLKGGGSLTMYDAAGAVTHRFPAED